MPWSLTRFQQARCLHFITFSCQHRDKLLSTPESRDTFLEILERTHTWYDFYITGYVVMPEHVHLPVSEPQRSKLAVVIQMLKQNAARKLRLVEGAPFWDRVTTTSMPGAKPRESRSCATSTATRFIADWSNVPRMGCGAASIITLLDTTLLGWKGLLRSNPSGLRGNVNEVELCQELVQEGKNPTLSHKTRQGWGTLTSSITFSCTVPPSRADLVRRRSRSRRAGNWSRRPHRHRPPNLDAAQVPA
jgi:REP element-mobilizing transposase RayT